MDYTSENKVNSPIERIGNSVDRHQDTSHIYGEGYREDRGIQEVEEEFKKVGFPLTIVELIQKAHHQFPTDDPLQIFEGGSGEGKLLAQIKGLQPRINERAISVTGISNEERNGSSEHVGQIDKMILGTLKEADDAGKLGGPYHVIIDLWGVGYYDTTYTKEGKPGAGVSTIPIYGKHLLPGGFLLYYHTFFNERLEDVWGAEPRERAVALLEENGLHILEVKGGFVLAQKRG